jgi:uncharacterized membrane protein YagU involved in acid resistance
VQSVTSELMHGGLAGLGATIPMSLFMEAGRRRLPWSEQYRLPPRQITDRLLRTVKLHRSLSERQQVGTTLAAHLAYGASMGGMYGALSKTTTRPGPAHGAAFGLMVWAANYLGVLPALGLLPDATKHPRRRTAVMIAAHVVWGSVLGGLFKAMDSRAEAPR